MLSLWQSDAPYANQVKARQFCLDKIYSSHQENGTAQTPDAKWTFGRQNLYAGKLDWWRPHVVFRLRAWRAPKYTPSLYCYAVCMCKAPECFIEWRSSAYVSPAGRQL
jgi:hypothetical protein